MIIPKKNISAVALAISLLLVSLGSFCRTANTDRKKKPDQIFRTAEVMLKRLAKGIVVDVIQPEEGLQVKVLYEPAQLDAAESAGFQSIRIYVVAGRDPAMYRTMIDEALARGLAVMISIWGKSEWASRPIPGIQDFAGVWDEFAKYYQDYPDDLVFDLLNEPDALIVQDGKHSGIADGKTVMQYLNSAISVIRATNPERIIGIGGPGLNGGIDLEEFVTPEYLTYKLEDGSGFEDDNHIIGLFHMYYPHTFTHWTFRLNQVSGWEEGVSEEISHAAAWSEKWGKPVILSEWGAWAPPVHSVEDFQTYIRFVVDECSKHSIEWIYYSLGFNNQWAFNILHTEDGWNQNALDILTGVTAPPAPPMSPIINAEFGWTTDNWISAGSATISVDRTASLSGPSALRVQAEKADRAEIYQETPRYQGSPPGRYLISVRNGTLYKIFFLAKSLNGTGSVRLRLADVSGSRQGFWTSEPVTIANEKEEYTIEYRHTGSDINDVRAGFLFSDKDQDILLDRIALRGYRE